jgi:Protein of unknown function (DUF1579)
MNKANGQNLIYHIKTRFIMRKNYLTVFVISVVCILFIACTATKPQPKQPVTITDEEKKRRAAEMLAMRNAGEEHKILNKLAGEWIYKTELLSSQKGTTVFMGNGIALNRNILENRFLVTECTKKTKEPMALGMMIAGFDRTTKQYTLTVYSEGGTYYVTASGTYNSATNSIETIGSYYNPVLKVYDNYDIIIGFINENRFSVAMNFKDKYSKSTASGIVTTFDRISNPQR